MNIECVIDCLKLPCFQQDLAYLGYDKILYLDLSCGVLELSDSMYKRKVVYVVPIIVCIKVF